MEAKDYGLRLDVENLLSISLEETRQYLLGENIMDNKKLIITWSRTDYMPWVGNCWQRRQYQEFLEKAAEAMWVTCHHSQMLPSV